MRVTNEDLAKLLGGGGFAAALLYLLYLVGSRIVAALDRVAVKVDDQGESIVRMDSKLDTLLGIGAEPDNPRARTGRTPVHGTPISTLGGYGPMRPGSRSG